MHRYSLILAGLLVACNGASEGNARSEATPVAAAAISPVDRDPFTIADVARFDEPWAMAFIPGTQWLLVTEKAGKLKLMQPGGAMIEVSGVPEVDYGGQGGLGDIIVAPASLDDDPADTAWPVYLSWVEAGSGDTRGAVVGRATLRLADSAEGGARTASLEGLRVIWKQVPKVTGRGHYSHRLVFSPDGQHLFIGSGERQKFDPAQDMAANLGKIVRLNPDGSVPADNPFADRGGVAAQVWTLGHRNILGLDFDAQGQLWAQEMGPKGGDELNRIEVGKNYGYPVVSNGDHYDGRTIPDHDTRPEFAAPAVTWNPVISPAGLLIYDGAAFPAWRGSAFIGGLSSTALIRVAFDGDGAREAERWDMKARIREVEQGPDGKLYILEDGENARLRRFDPR